jgi:iron(III) transport system permease protein
VATVTPLPETPAPRRTGIGRWWLALAALGLLPSLIPLASLVIATIRDGAVATVPGGRLAQLMANTLVLAVTVTATATALGTATAWLVTRTTVPMRRMWTILVALPLVMPSYVVALTLLGATGPTGVLSELVGGMGLGPIPVPDGFFGSWLALTVFAVPYVHLAAVPAIRGIDPALEEASRSLGVSRWHTFRKVTLPMLRPATTASALLVSLYTISDFGVVSLLRYDTFTRAIYAQYQGRLDRRPALTLALVLIVVAVAIVWFERRTRRHARYEGAPSARPAPIDLGRGWTATAVGFLTGLTTVSIAIPSIVLFTWLARGATAGQPIGAPVAETLRSLLVSVAAAVVAALVSIPVAMVTVRGRQRAAAAAETVTWMSYALPHIAMGLAMVTFALRVAPGLYQTTVLLVIAYVAMFLPQTVATSSDSLRRINPSLEEASRSLGRSAIETTMRITLPLMRRGLLAGAALVFLTTMKELPATLLLRPNEFETLAIRIWAATGEGFYTRASAAALILLAVSAIPLALVTIRDLDR